jgi:uncharacterized protein
MIFDRIIAERLGIQEWQVKNTIRLMEEGGTVPFIARYRKEATGSLEDVQLAALSDLLEKLKELAKRKESILKSIEEQGKLSPELRKKIEDCQELAELEDLYLPYKPKRKTRASIARENGLGPLAELILKQTSAQLQTLAGGYLNEKVPTVEDALAGARDIIAEQVNEDANVRNLVRRHFSREAVISSKVVKGKEAEAATYRDYFDYQEELRRCPSHRFLAMRRGEEEGFLRLSISPRDSENVVEGIERKFIKGNTASAAQLKTAINDSYKRLLEPSIETEFSRLAKEKSDEEAIRVFAENLRQLLLSAPLGRKRMLAIDPGFRTGCKIACLDEQGNLLHHDVIYPHPPQEQKKEAAEKLRKLTDRFATQAIAIGNGTAGRETEEFVRDLYPGKEIHIFMVSESGASIYSASAVAREEFPDQDVTVRGAVSIGRRLMDPLAELVKIDPKSIGVGQYQHDVDQKKLKESLDRVVEHCVNRVGVNLNTASKQLLTYVAGLGPQIAQNIVEYRSENGPFRSRAALKKVKRMGEKAFEQCAGFLRIPEATNPLDNSAVHPERYALVARMAEDMNASVKDLLQDEPLRKKIDLRKYVDAETGMPTLLDILAELNKPGLDPRDTLKVFEYAAGIHTMDQLREGMILPGIVTNITNFGAFVDVGVKQDGLVHISQLSDNYVSDPNSVVKLQQQVMVKVTEVDLARKRISLSMKGLK